MPSMTVPSWLFQEMTSAVPSVQSFTWADMSVSFLGANGATRETNNSLVMCVAIFRDEGQGLEIRGERDFFQEQSVWRGDALDFGRTADHAKEMRVGFLRCAEIDAVGSPIDRVGILVEFGG